MSGKSGYGSFCDVREQKLLYTFPLGFDKDIDESETIFNFLRNVSVSSSDATQTYQVVPYSFNEHDTRAKPLGELARKQRADYTSDKSDLPLLLCTLEILDVRQQLLHRPAEKGLRESLTFARHE